MKQTKKVWLRYCFLCVCLFLSMWLSCINQLFIIRNVAVINDFRLIIMLDRRPTIDCDLPHPWGKHVNETVPLTFITNFKLIRATTAVKMHEYYWINWIYQEIPSPMSCAQSRSKILQLKSWQIFTVQKFSMAMNFIETKANCTFFSFSCF